MAFQPAPNIMLAEVRMLVDQEEVENTLYFSDGAAVTTGKMASVAEFLRDQWGADAPPLLTDSQILREVYMTDLSSSDGNTYGEPFPPNTRGTILEGYMPTTNCLHVIFKAQGRGRTNRGGNDWGALPRGIVTKNLISQGYIDAVIAFYTALKTVTTVIPGMQWGFVSRSIDKVLRPAGVFKAIQSVYVSDQVVDSCRSRKQGQG